MKHHYVKTSNHRTFADAVTALESRGSPEACILLLSGPPGTGKSCTVDNWGASVDALTLEGIPGMNVSYVRDWLASQTGVVGKTRFEQYEATVKWFRGRAGAPIILDEAQHGLPEKAACIEYLRRLLEQARRPDVYLVLVCHSTERHRFSEARLAHIATRTSAAPQLQPANVDDCALYLAESCDIALAADIAHLVHKQSRGRYRLMANAVRMLEAIALAKGLKALTAADIKGETLCEDVLAEGRK